jgi:transcriptional regulator with XRE-family HTH domain
MKKKSKYSSFNQIGENISRFMEVHGIDATELARYTGLPTSTISRLRSNPTDCSPNLSSLMPIAEFFHLTISQLIGEDQINPEHYEITLHQSRQQKISIPLLQAEEIMHHTSGHLVASQYILVDIPIHKEAFAYLLQGSAMEPQFPDKTLLIIDPTIVPENLDYAVVMQFNKKLPIFRQILIEENEKYIKASNPLFNEFTKLSEERDRIIGVMVQSRRNFKTKDFIQPDNLISTPFHKNKKAQVS